ncbi:MAG: CobW family GTP-binding protein [Acetobacteraceae bacterium]
MTSPAPGRPVTVVTGFLGAGKTTLIGRVLRDPAFARCAVIVNEWGEVGIDHALIASGNETLLTLANGCLCCRVQGSLADTIARLPEHDRVLIETSGLADPGPILAALLELGSSHAPGAVVTLIPAPDGAELLARHVEARRQLALADRVVLTKTDLAPPDPALTAALAATGLPVTAAVAGQAAPALLFAPAGALPLRERLAGLEPDGPNPFARGRHGRGLGSAVVARERPIAGAALSLFIETLMAHSGPRLLRLKGIATLAEAPERPLLIQAVGHRAAPAEFLPSWPADWPAGATRLVVIFQDMPRWFASRLLSALEAEVTEA